VTDVRPFVPARDFALSRDFYVALGWTELWSDGTLALLELGASRFVLQDRWVRAWAENCMLTVEVDDAEAWHAHVTGVLAAREYDGARASDLVREDWATVTYVWDPSGVLLHVAQFPPAEITT
jgi:hypothetical protein